MTLCVTFDENKSFFQDKVHGLRRLYASTKIEIPTSQNVVGPTIMAKTLDKKSLLIYKYLHINVNCVINGPLTDV